ncbi:hypothetical protein NDU88_008083 [Pleurodeles waltl]|uniref:Uncharacterized protein n=1 Tax=Pleurodeles waltl TaxID=8319 RepID=A0AAV7VRI9_PLEWA|nr:hypothetical protein NDU88_008083 [Pleurodeles waltl]
MAVTGSSHLRLHHKPLESFGSAPGEHIKVTTTWKRIRTQISGLDRRLQEKKKRRRRQKRHTIRGSRRRRGNTDLTETAGRTDPPRLWRGAAISDNKEPTELNQQEMEDIDEEEDEETGEHANNIAGQLTVLMIRNPCSSTRTIGWSGRRVEILPQVVKSRVNALKNP